MQAQAANPLFTIITVCYNSGETIERAIKSVLEQAYTDYEYIIIDGMSTDNTLEIVRSYPTKFQGKMKYISEADNGIYDAINKGIALAKGSLIGILNSDDWYESNTLDVIAAHHQPGRDVIYYGLLRYLREGKEYMVLSYNHEFLNEKMINHPTCFVTKGIYNEVGKYDLKYKLAADYDFMLNCKEKGYNFRHLPFILSNMSMEGSSKDYHLRSRVETYNIMYKHKCLSNANRMLRIIDLYLKYYFKKIFGL
ncbi:MAG: glycosyltransferase [Ignavibacteriaceae bacterium]|nr:glycosyltransferase [Ignavibacteriaceae bacterium]